MDRFGFLKVAAAIPHLRVGDCDYNAGRMTALAEQAAQRGAEIVVFPELSLTGYTCGDLLLQPTLLDAAEEALEELVRATRKLPLTLIAGAPLRHGETLYNCAVVFTQGRILGAVPKSYIPGYAEFYEQRHFAPAPKGHRLLKLAENVTVDFSTDILFCDAAHPEVCVACEICEDLWVSDAPSARHAAAGATVIVNLSASNETIGKREYRKTLVSAQSGRCACAYVYADAGMGESSSDLIFAGNHLIYENGALLGEAEPFSGGEVCADLDAEYLLNERRRMNTVRSLADGEGDGYLRESVDIMSDAEPTLCALSSAPFVPAEEGERGERAQLILGMQAQALARRLAHTNAKTAVIGISGGLDSTLALLAAVRAFDLLKKDRKNIFAYTMPGFGTTGKTKGNSLALMEAMGVTARTVPISAAVLKHFEDIGHDPKVLNAAYENAQARYRTMILMDVANETGGLVVGTGDLSELALGWCTYNGDHMSMYAVNCGVPKTLVKHLVRAEAKRLGGKTERILEDILATEISPELLPPDAAGNIAQKTEDIVGPYELHDFFLFRFLRRGDRPAKTLYLAERAFAGRYGRAELKKWLINFYRRFFSQQFKRNCVPDGVKVGSVSLSPRGDWRMPSDASASLWLDEAEKL